jgi:EAL domain-containing protein (putative c-di-GMP-specific phosphodiesterase class I)
MHELKSLGIGVSLDDFGAGYSSLSCLRQLPIDELKIDRTFIRDIEADADERAIVQTIVGMARNLRLAIVAEGVETQAQHLLLRQLGCHAFQGHLFGRPVPLRDLERLLRERSARQAVREREDAPGMAASG